MRRGSVELGWAGLSWSSCRRAAYRSRAGRRPSTGRPALGRSRARRLEGTTCGGGIRRIGAVAVRGRGCWSGSGSAGGPSRAGGACASFVARRSKRAALSVNSQHDRPTTIAPSVLAQTAQARPGVLLPLRPLATPSARRTLARLPGTALPSGAPSQARTPLRRRHVVRHGRPRARPAAVVGAQGARARPDPLPPAPPVDRPELGQRARLVLHARPAGRRGPARVQGVRPRPPSWPPSPGASPPRGAAHAHRSPAGADGFLLPLSRVSRRQPRPQGPARPEDGPVALGRQRPVVHQGPADLRARHGHLALVGRRRGLVVPLLGSVDRCWPDGARHGLVVVLCGSGRRGREGGDVPRPAQGGLRRRARRRARVGPDRQAALWRGARPGRLRRRRLPAADQSRQDDQGQGQEGRPRRRSDDEGRLGLGSPGLGRASSLLPLARALSCLPELAR